MDWSPPGSSVHGILQARILEWMATPSSRRSSRSMDWTHLSCVFCIAGGFFTAEPLGKPTVFLLLKHQASLVGTRAGDHSYTRSLKAFLGHDWNKLWCWRRKQYFLDDSWNHVSVTISTSFFIFVSSIFICSVTSEGDIVYLVEICISDINI